MPQYAELMTTRAGHPEIVDPVRLNRSDQLIKELAATTQFNHLAGTPTVVAYVVLAESPRTQGAQGLQEGTTVVLHAPILSVEDSSRCEVVSHAAGASEPAAGVEGWPAGPIPPSAQLLLCLTPEAAATLRDTLDDIAEFQGIVGR